MNNSSGDGSASAPSRWRLPLAAAAQQAFTRGWLNLRAGLATDYPAGRAPRARPAAHVMGCTAGYGWCDVVLPDGLRGWAYAARLDIPYEERRVPLATYGAVIGVPIVDLRDRQLLGQLLPRPTLVRRAALVARPAATAADAGWRPPPPPRPGWRPRPPRPNPSPGRASASAGLQAAARAGNPAAAGAGHPAAARRAASATRRRAPASQGPDQGGPAARRAAAGQGGHGGGGAAGCGRGRWAAAEGAAVAWPGRRGHGGGHGAGQGGGRQSPYAGACRLSFLRAMSATKRWAPRPRGRSRRPHDVDPQVQPVRQVLERDLDQRAGRHVRPREIARQPAPAEAGGDQAQRRQRVVGAPDVPREHEARIAGRQVAAGDDDLPRGRQVLLAQAAARRGEHRMVGRHHGHHGVAAPLPESPRGRRGSAARTPAPVARGRCAAAPAHRPAARPAPPPPAAGIPAPAPPADRSRAPPEARARWRGSAGFPGPA